MTSLSLLAGTTVSSLAHSIHYVQKMHSPVVGDNTTGSHMQNKPCLTSLALQIHAGWSVSQTTEIITFYIKMYKI